jgi:hypothetical protein
MLIPYEQLFIQTFHHNGHLITEQSTGEQNPLFQLAIDTMLTSATTRKQNRSTRHLQHTQISFKSSTIAAEWYVHHPLFYRTYYIFRTIYIIQQL